MIKRLKRELYQLRKTAALTKDSQAILELQNSNKANQEDLVKAEKSAQNTKKQAMEAEEKFKKVQAIMAKQILSGTVGHYATRSTATMDVLLEGQGQKGRNGSRGAKEGDLVSRRNGIAIQL